MLWPISDGRGQAVSARHGAARHPFPGSAGEGSGPAWSPGGTDGSGGVVVLEMTFIGFRLSRGAPAPRRSPHAAA